MKESGYYWAQAARARRLGEAATDPETARALFDAADDFEDVAEDLESGVIDIRHPEMLPQRQH